MPTLRFGGHEVDLDRLPTREALQHAYGSQGFRVGADTWADLIYLLKHLLDAVTRPDVAPVTVIRVGGDQTSVERTTALINLLVKRDPLKWGYLTDAIITNGEVEIEMIPGEVVSKTVTPDNLTKLVVRSKLPPTRLDILLTEEP